VQDLPEMVQRQALRLVSGPPLAGGQATLERCLDPTGRPRLFKRYRPEALVDLYPDALVRGIRWRRDLVDRAWLDAMCAWPLAAVAERASVVGVLLQPADPAMHEHFARAGLEARDTPRHLSDLGRDETSAGRLAVPYHPPPVKLTVLATLVRTVQWLHRHGYCVGDLHPGNALFEWRSGSRYARTLVLDVDACVPVGGRPALPPVEPEVWRMPGSRAHGIATDYWKLGWIVVRCLLEYWEASTDDLASHLANLSGVLDSRRLRMLNATCSGAAPESIQGEWEAAALMWPTLVRPSGLFAFVGEGRYTPWPPTTAMPVDGPRRNRPRARARAAALLALAAALVIALVVLSICRAGS
jgi:hypothetical protein